MHRQLLACHANDGCNFLPDSLFTPGVNLGFGEFFMDTLVQGQHFVRQLLAVVPNLFKEFGHRVVDFFSEFAIWFLLLFHFGKVQREDYNFPIPTYSKN